MIQFRVHVPDDTPGDAPVFLSGNLPELGAWRPDAVPRERRPDGSHVGRLAVPPSVPLEFLVTRGTWRTAEADASGRVSEPRLWPTDGPPEVVAHVAAWRHDSVRYHHDFPSRALKNRRTITVYLPPEYDAHPDRRFPVFYLHDGQNLFDAHTSYTGVPWAADATAERLIRAGQVRPVILVGIANTAQRLEEYGPRPRSAAGPDRGRRYARFVVAEVKSFIDRTYRTLPGQQHTAVGGSSMGGLISLAICRWYPVVFSGCAALSPSLWWQREWFLRSAQRRGNWPRGLRVWLDMGDREGGGPTECAMHLRRTARFAEMLAAAGLVADRDYVYRSIPGGGHNERDWAARFDQVLVFLFGAGRPGT